MRWCVEPFACGAEVGVLEVEVEVEAGPVTGTVAAPVAVAFEVGVASAGQKRPLSVVTMMIAAKATKRIAGIAGIAGGDRRR